MNANQTGGGRPTRPPRHNRAGLDALTRDVGQAGRTLDDALLDRLGRLDAGERYQAIGRLEEALADPPEFQIRDRREATE